MSLSSFWYARQIKRALRAEWPNVVVDQHNCYWDDDRGRHVLAKAKHASLVSWCQVTSSTSENGRPAEEAETLPYHVDEITCATCRFMHNLNNLHKVRL